MGVRAAAILLVKGVTEGLALFSSNVFLAAGHMKGDGPLIALWALIAAGSLWLLVRYLTSMSERQFSLAG